MIYLLYFVTDDFGELPDQETLCVVYCVASEMQYSQRLLSKPQELIIQARRGLQCHPKVILNLTRRDLRRRAFPPNSWYWRYSSTEFLKRDLSFNISPMTSLNAGSVVSSSFDHEAFVEAEIDLGDIKLAMQLTWYRSSAACKSLKSPPMRTLTWLAISSLRRVPASNIDSLNAFLPGPAYVVRQSTAFFQRSRCFLSFSFSHVELAAKNTVLF